VTGTSIGSGAVVAGIAMRGRTRTTRNAALVALLAFLAINPGGAQQVASVERGAARPTLVPLVQRVAPAVVNIAAVGTTKIESPLLQDPFFRRFFGTPPDGSEGIVPTQAAGSGVIIDARNGYVLTNHHVIENADEIAVNLADRRQLSAKLIGSDPETDIALLKIDATELVALEIGDSDSLGVGDYVVAIGNPFGLGQTVTSGIVSALGRAGLGIEGYESFIQTDAAINPGNSGGALIDLDGELVGIATAIASPTGGNVGIGFAVPSNMAKAVMEQLLEYGEVRRGRLGIMIQDLTPALAQALEIGVDRGALVTGVEPDSAAARAGVKAGDVVVALNGAPIADSTELRNRIGLTRADETVKLGIRRDGLPIDVDVRVVAAEPERAATRAPATGNKLDGAELRDLDRSDPRYRSFQGVLVATVRPASAAWRAGLQAGDIIVAVNRRAVTTTDQLTAALRDARVPFAVEVERDGGRVFLVVQ
jgi:serine protease DegQ